MPTYAVDVGPLTSQFGPDLPLALRSYLAEEMAILVEGARFMPLVRDGRWDGRVKYFSAATGVFYTGLLEHVTTLLQGKGATVTLLRSGRHIPAPRMDDIEQRITLRDYQATVVTDAQKRERGIIEAAVNAGKTEIALEIIRRLRVQTLYLVPSKELFTQAVERASDVLPGMHIGGIKAGMMEPGLLTIAMVQSVLKGLTRRDAELVEYLRDVECVFADEVHHMGGQQWSGIFKACKSAHWRFGLSATPLGMSKVRDMLLIGLTGPVFGKITTQELVKRGLSTKTEVRFIKYEHEGAALSMLDGSEWQTLYELGIEVNRDRAQAMLTAIRPHLEQLQKVCIFVNTIDHGDFLRAAAQERFAGTDFTPQTLYGEEPPTERKRVLDLFRNGARPLLITTLLKEGLNLPEMDVLVIAGGGKSATASIQQAGRVLRTRKGKLVAIIYDCIDPAHDILLGHSRERYKAYKGEGFAVDLIDCTGDHVA